MSAENQHSFTGPYMCSLRAPAHETDACSEKFWRVDPRLIPSWVGLTHSSAHRIVAILSDSRRFSMIPGDSSESYWWTRLSNFQNQSLRFYWIKLIPYMILKYLSTSHWFWIDYKYGKSLILPVNGPSIGIQNNVSLIRARVSVKKRTDYKQLII